MKWLRSRVNLLKNDKNLLIIMLLHIILAVCHVGYYYMVHIKYHADIRCVSCLIIALLIFLFGRIGLAYGFLMFACFMVYMNTFYNYSSIFLILIVFGAYPKIKWHTLIIYLTNILIAFSKQGLLPFAIGIHTLYFGIFYFSTQLVYVIKKPSKLKLTEDEKKILNEMVDGKLQKEIELFSPQTITAKIKSARERNMCETTPELLALYTAEIGIKIGKCGKPCKKNCPQRESCCLKDS